MLHDDFAMEDPGNFTQHGNHPARENAGDEAHRDDDEGFAVDETVEQLVGAYSEGDVCHNKHDSETIDTADNFLLIFTPIDLVYQSDGVADTESDAESDEDPIRGYIRPVGVYQYKDDKTKRDDRKEYYSALEATINDVPIFERITEGVLKSHYA